MQVQLAVALWMSCKDTQQLELAPALRANSMLSFIVLLPPSPPSLPNHVAGEPALQLGREIPDAACRCSIIQAETGG